MVSILRNLAIRFIPMQPINAPKSMPSGKPSFSLGNRMFRAVWSISWVVLAGWTPAPLFGWRRLVLGAFGAKLGRGVRVYGSTRVLYPPNLTMGDYAVIGPNAICYCMGRITLGDHVTVSQYAHLVTGSHSIDEPSFQLIIEPIEICSKAWIASSAFVGPGVTIGEGAVLGAKGVAFRDLKPWTVYAGNPARPIRQRTQF